MLDGGRASEDGEGVIGGDRRDDGVSRQRREVGEQALETVDGEAVGRASGGALGEVGGRSLRLGDGGLLRRASAASLSSSS